MSQHSRSSLEWEREKATEIGMNTNIMLAALLMLAGLMVGMPALIFRDALSGGEVLGLLGLSLGLSVVALVLGAREFLHNLRQRR
jgi:hypothetical protein